MTRVHLPILDQPYESVQHPVTNHHFQLLRSTYGALSESPSDPLSAVSVANSSLSIDLWKGCPWQCAYCHVQGSRRNLDDGHVMPKKVTKHSLFSEEEVLDELVTHPFFTPHQTILSIGTSSTEPLASGEVEGSTFEILRILRERKLKNPVWIVTKNHVARKRLHEIKLFCDTGAVLVFSPTINGLNSTIEPLQGDRFKNWRKVSEAGAKVALYLRPLVREWGSNEYKISEILEFFKKEMGSVMPSAIVPGGLRWTDGIDYGLQVRGLQWPQNLPRVENGKDLDDALWHHIVQESQRLFPGVPIVHHSSCALSTILMRSDLSLVFNHATSECQESHCSPQQRGACNQANTHLREQQLGIEQNVLEELGLLGISDVKTLPYAMRRTIQKIVADRVRVTY